MSFPSPAQLEPLIAKALGPLLAHAEEIQYTSMGSMSVPSSPSFVAQVAPGVLLRLQASPLGGGTITAFAGSTSLTSFTYPPSVQGAVPGFDCAALSATLAHAMSEAFGHVLGAMADLAAASGVSDEEAVHALRLAMARSVHAS